MKGYKFLTTHMKSKNGEESPWEIGVWKEYKGTIELCSSGYHFSQKPLDSLEYIYGSRWFEVEADGEIIRGDAKNVCSKLKLVREIPLSSIMIDFSIACAKNCLFRFEQRYPNDSRPRMAIEAAQNISSAAADAADAAHTAARAAHAARAAADAAYYKERNWQNNKLLQLINQR